MSTTTNEVNNINHLFAEFLGYSLITPAMRKHPENWTESYYEKPITHEVLGVEGKLKFHKSIQYLDKIRKKIPDIEFTCDIITGFPGERDEDFEEGAEFIESLKFSNVHIFQYSDRENTEASKMAEKVEPKIKKERSEKLEIRVNKIGEEIRKSYIDKKVKLLVEEIEENFSYGYSENYIRIKSEETDVKPGDILQVIVKKVEKGMLIGGKKNI